MKKIVITGGTGVLGSALVNQLNHQPGVEVLVVSRNRQRSVTYGPVVEQPGLNWKPVDLVSGDGLAKALTQADIVFHLASDTATINGTPADVLAMNNLLRVAQQTHVKHLIYSSIVGVDRIPFGYYKTKLRAETMLAQSMIPYTILRATQFHTFIDFIFRKLFTLPIGLVPKRWKAQPISPEAVADELLNCANQGPQQTVINIGGPQVLDFGTMAAIWQRHQSRIKPIVGLPLLGEVMQSFAKGYNTCPEVSLFHPLGKNIYSDSDPEIPTLQAIN